MKINSIILTDKNFKHEVLEHHQPVLVEFAADWCGPCHIIGPIVDRLTEEFGGQIKFCKIDCDLNPGLKNTFGIHNLPTFLFFIKGQLIDHIVGAVSQGEFSGRLQNLLQGSAGEDTIDGINEILK